MFWCVARARPKNSQPLTGSLRCSVGGARSGIDLVYHNGKTGDTYNIGGRNERTNLQIVDRICTILDKEVPKEKSYKELITFVEDRAGHDRRYAIDATKLENELGWKADENFDSGIVKTIAWYLNKYNISGK